MQRSWPRPIQLMGLGALLCASAAVARDGISLERGWAQVDYTEDGTCRAEVKSNGKFYRIAGAGWPAGEEVRFHLDNGATKPVEYRMVADAEGNLVRYYIPFLWNRRDGMVTADLASASCAVNLRFDWARNPETDPFAL